HLPEEKLRDRLTSLRRERRGWQRPADIRPDSADPSQNRATTQPTRLSDLPSGDRDLLELIILEPALISRLTETIEPNALISPVARSIYSACRRLAVQGSAGDFGRLMAEFDDAEIKN